jgi:hypothetical protein
MGYFQINLVLLAASLLVGFLLYFDLSYSSAYLTSHLSPNTSNSTYIHLLLGLTLLHLAL